VRWAEAKWCTNVMENIQDILRFFAMDNGEFRLLELSPTEVGMEKTCTNVFLIVHPSGFSMLFIVYDDGRIFAIHLVNEDGESLLFGFDYPLEYNNIQLKFTEIEINSEYLHLPDSCTRFKTWYETNTGVVYFFDMTNNSPYFGEALRFQSGYIVTIDILLKAIYPSLNNSTPS